MYFPIESCVRPFNTFEGVTIRRRQRAYLRGTKVTHRCFDCEGHLWRGPAKITRYLRYRLKAVEKRRWVFSYSSQTIRPRIFELIRSSRRTNWIGSRYQNIFEIHLEEIEIRPEYFDEYEREERLRWMSSFACSFEGTDRQRDHL